MSNSDPYQFQEKTHIELRADTYTLPSPEMRKAMYEAEVGNITTIDIKIKAEGNALNYDIPYSNLRYRGAIVQIYINGAFGKDQWVAMPFLRGVFLMSNSIHLPIDEWVEDGFPVGKYIRVVIIHSE